MIQKLTWLHAEKWKSARVIENKKRVKEGSTLERTGMLSRDVESAVDYANLHCVMSSSENKCDLQNRE
jgi:hypothetical protein